MPQHPHMLAHWAPRGDLEAIRADMARKGVHQPTLEDLAVHDQLHAGLMAGTVALADWLGVARGARVVDLGAGLGGSARWLARERDCRVLAVDLCPELVETGRDLSRWTGLDHRVQHLCADATSVRQAADLVWIQFVDMTWADKAGLYGAVRRCLGPGGRAGWHDWLAGPDGPPRHPLFWSADGALTHLSTPERFQENLAAAGLRLLRLEVQLERTVAWFERSRDGLAHVLGTLPPGPPRRPRLEALAQEVDNALWGMAHHRLLPFFAEASP